MQSLSKVLKIIEATVRMVPEDEQAENAEPKPVLEDARKFSEGKKKRRTRANSKPSTAISTGPKSTATSSDFDTRMQDLKSKMKERFTTLMNTFNEGLSRLEERQPDKQTRRHPREERENENGDRHVAVQTQRAGSARHRSDDNDSDSDNSPRHRRGYEDDVLSVNEDKTNEMKFFLKLGRRCRATEFPLQQTFWCAEKVKTSLADIYKIPMTAPMTN